MPGPASRSLLDRMADKFTVGDGCWLWTGSRTAQGYGKISAGGRRGPTLRAHRVLYEIMVGPIPDGLEPDHLCGVKSCVRPSHIEPVTHAENVRRAQIGNRGGATHCPRGHLFDAANTYVTPDGRRQCCECRRERKRRHRRGSRN